jgi:hypothetical protein
MLSRRFRNAKDLADPPHSLFLRQTAAFGRFRDGCGNLVLFDFPIEPFAVEFEALLRHVDFSGVLRQPAFDEGDAGDANERLAIPVPDGFLHQECGVAVTRCFGRIRIAQLTELAALLKGLSVFLKAMLLFLPLDEARVGHIPFEVDAEAVLDFNDGLFA